MNKQAENSVTHTTNGHSTKSNKRVKRQLVKSDFYIADNGSFVFSNWTTLDDIPAGEYYPTRDRNAGAQLKPIVRASRYGDEAIIGEAGHYVSPAETGDSEVDEFIQEFSQLLENDDYIVDGSKLGNSFVPVHRYFPIEKWSAGIREADRNVRQFLKQRPFYRKLKMDYRRSILLYGDPGTGKSQYLYHLTKDLIRDHDAIVMRVESSNHFDALHDEIQYRLGTRHDRLKVIIIEELAEFINYGKNSNLLSLLDSMNLRENVLFLITTNFPEKIPDNIVDRPSRLDLLTKVEVSDYDADFVRAWYAFILEESLSEEQQDENWFQEVPGQLSPAYLKELFVYSRLHGLSIDETWANIKNRKQQIKDEFKETKENQIGFSFLE